MENPEVVAEIAEAVETAAESAVQNLSTPMVILLGFGTVFIGLIALIFIVKLMSVVYGSVAKKKPAEVPAVKAAPAPAAAETIENREQVIAAASAAIAETMGKDVSAIRIVSVKKVK